MASRILSDDEVLIQLGRSVDGRGHFRDRPRPIDQGALSVVVGDVSLAEAVAMAFRRQCLDTDTSRRTTVGQLRARGFDVEHTPTRMNSAHASVSHPGAWTDEICRRFSACFV